MTDAELEELAQRMDALPNPLDRSAGLALAEEARCLRAAIREAVEALEAYPVKAWQSDGMGRRRSIDTESILLRLRAALEAK